MTKKSVSKKALKNNAKDKIISSKNRGEFKRGKDKNNKRKIKKFKRIKSKNNDSKTQKINPKKSEVAKSSTSPSDASDRLLQIKEAIQKMEDSGEYNPDLEELQDYIMYEEEIENLPRVKFKAYDLPKTKQQHKKYVENLMRKCDVILEILDARDVVHSHVPEKIEGVVKKDPKKQLILVINKVDLVSNQFLAKITSKLSKESPTVKILTNSSYQSDKVVSFYNDLVKVLKNKREKSKKLLVGIIGYPNVGKTSLIHKLRSFSFANSEGRNITFSKNKFLSFDYVPGVILDDDEKDSLLISKTAKAPQEIPNLNDLLNGICSIINIKRTKVQYGFVKTPSSLEELKNAFITKYKYNELYKGKSKAEISKAVLEHIYRDLVNGKLNFEYLE